MVKIGISLYLKEFCFSREVFLSREPSCGEDLIVFVEHMGKQRKVLVRVERAELLIEDDPISRYKVVPLDSSVCPTTKIFLESTKSPDWCVINTITQETKPA